MAKVNCNFISDLLRYQSKNHIYFKYLDHKIMNTPVEKLTKVLTQNLDKKLVAWFFSANFYLGFITTFIE
ncbi:hypothetical protein [Mesomycoplasma ovipneumoniae]|uniref:hypothetical protein n=1 Tax=Mesomycoplasma ovipneumoniae TaxID=29562 RepID=UPI0039F57175